jgi:hypothetical protein
MVGPTKKNETNIKLTQTTASGSTTNKGKGLKKRIKKGTRLGIS